MWASQGEKAAPGPKKYQAGGWGRPGAGSVAEELPLGSRSIEPPLAVCSTSGVGS